MGDDRHSDEDFDDRDYDELESSLLHENFSAALSAKVNALSGIDLDNRINLSSKVRNDVARSEEKGTRKPNMKGREDRATTEQVLDPRTRMILFKLMGKGFLQQIDGCLSTGKEANVYYARGEGDKEYAVKIFKTSILVFKDRDRYVSGEYRFRHGYCRSNPRKMVKVWAEKEMRNLKRLQQSNLLAPIPHLLKSHVLIMDFIGKNGWCAPRLKDADIDDHVTLRKTYLSICMLLRHLLRRCGLVHGDLSEYNLLYHEEKVYVIDVSQSVELAHPLALDFLRMDATNVTSFFKRKGLHPVLSVMQLYHFATMDEIGDEDEVELNHLKSLLERTGEHDDNTDHNNDTLDENQQNKQNRREVDEAVFMRAFIPTRLSDIPQPHLEMQRLAAGQREGVFTAAMRTMLATQGEHHDAEDNEDGEGDDSDEEDFQRLLGALRGTNKPSTTTTTTTNTTNDKPESQSEELTIAVAGPEVEGEEETKPIKVKTGDEDSEKESDDDEEGEGDTDDSDDDEEEGSGAYRRQLPNHNNPEDRLREKENRKAARKAAKEAAAVRRQTKKIPKHVKKRATQKGSKK